MFGTFCEFLSENLKQITMLNSNDKRESGMMKMIVFLLWKMVRQWCNKSYHSEVRKNQVELQTILLTLKQFLQQYVNKTYIKNQSDKLGIYSASQNHSQIPFSPSSVIINASFTQQSMQSLPQIPSRIALYNQHETSPTQLLIEFTSSYTISQLYLSVYSMLIFLYYYNDQSMLFRENATSYVNKSQILSSMIFQLSPKKQIPSTNQQEQQFSQESIYFVKDHFLSLLSESLEILFHLSTGGKQLSMMSEMFIMSSHLLIFKSNSQKPTLLRLNLYGEKKMTKKHWPNFQMKEQQNQRYLKLVENYLMLDPKFRHKMLRLIEQWLQMGVDLMNQGLMSHWKVLIDIINKRIFQGLLQGEMFNLLISKSQGNRQCRYHLGYLLSEMVEHISIEIIVKNSEQIFCMEEFLEQKRIKLLEIYFECIKGLLEKKNTVNNKTMVNRVVSLYLQLKYETKIKKMEFVEVFRMLVQNSVYTGEKLFTQKNLKAIHIPQQACTSHMLASSQKFLAYSHRFTQQIDLSQSNRSQLALSSKLILTSRAIDQIVDSNENEVQQVQEVEIIMLHELFDQRKKGESYFLKFMKQINKSYFNEENIKVYEIYAEYLISKLTDGSLSAPEFNKPISITITPQSFQRFYGLYETLFAIVHDKKVLSFNLYKSMLLLEAVTEREKLSERYHWFARKLKYFFAPVQHQQSIRSRIISMGGSDISRLDMSLDLSRKTSVQFPQSRVELNEKLCLSLFDYIKHLFMKLKNKVTFLALISMFSLRYCQTHRKIINMEKKQQNKRKSTTQFELATQLAEINDFLQENNYALILSTCSMSTNILMVMYNLVLMNEYLSTSGIKSNIFQSGSKIKQFDYADFLEIDQNPLLVEIRKILVLMINSFNPYQINEFLYLFTMKQSHCEKLLTFLGLPSFESIPLIARIQPIVKIIKQITTKKYLSLQKRQLLLPFYNHIELNFINIPKSQFNMIKNQQKTYIISTEMLINWSIKCDNFISFWTDKGKYKLIIKQQQFSVLYRKDGSNLTQKFKDYDIKTQLKENVLIQLSIKSKQMNVYGEKKKLIATINCDSQIQGIKLQLINGLLVQKISVAKTSPQIDFHQKPQQTPISFEKSFLKLSEVQMEIKIKQISILNNQAAWMTFPYEKYYFLLRQLVKFNRDLAEHRSYEFLSKILTETYLKMLENNAITTSSFIVNSSKFLTLNKKKSSSVVQSKRQSQKYVSNTVNPEQMWKILIKSMNDYFIEKKNQPTEKKRYNSISKLERKYSQDTAFMKLNLIRTSSNKSRPQSQDDDFMFGKSESSIDIKDNFIELPKLPDISKSSKLYCATGFSFYLLQILLRKEIWEYWSENDKVEISTFLKDLFSHKDFLMQVQNDTFDIFYNLVNVLQKLSENQSIVPKFMIESKESFSEMPQSPLSTQILSPQHMTMKNISSSLKQILLTHQLGQLLKKKYRYLFYIGQTGKSKLVKQLFLSILDKLSCSLLLNDSLSNTKMSHWLIIQSQRFQYVFGTCRQQTRVRILDYLSQISPQNQENKLINFMQKLSLQMIYEVRMWIMIYIKKLLFKLKMKQNVLRLMKQLGEIVGVLLKVADEITDKADKQHKDKNQKETEKQQLLKIVQQTILYMQKRQELNQPISKQLELILLNENFIRYFQSLISQNVLIPTAKTNCSVTTFCSVIFNTIFGLQKMFLLKALTTYRKLANKSIPLLIYPLKLQLSRKLSVYQLNCFLQYVLEATLSVQNSIGAQQKSNFVISVKTYLEWLIKNYQSKKQQIVGALVYVYPKIYHILNCHLQKELEQKLREVGNADIMELRGGIYFKLIVIVMHLIQMKPDEDFSMLIDVIIFKPLDQKEHKDQKQLFAAIKAMNDFSQVQTSSRQRTFVQKLINQLSPSHKLYSAQHDQPLQPLQVVSNKLTKFEQQNDLTIYFIDYMLMKLVQYLSESINKFQDPNAEEIKKKYANLIHRALEKFPLICNDLNEKNIDSIVPLYNYSSLVKLLSAQQEQLLVGQKLTSPKSRHDAEMETPSTPQKNCIDESYFEKLHTQTPSKFTKNIQLYENQRFTKTAGKRDEFFLNVSADTRKRRRSFHYFITNQSAKVRDSILDLIKKDHKKWTSQCRQKMFNEFFRDEAKQLLIIELMFTFFVENTVLKPPMSTISQKQTRLLQKYFQSVEQEIQIYEDIVQRPLWSNKQLIRIFSIKRLSPYFLQSPPILKVKGSGFPNMCMPIMTQIPKPSYKLRDKDSQKKLENCQSLQRNEPQFRIDMFGINYQNEEQKNDIEEIQEFQMREDDYDNEFDNIAQTPKKKSFYSGSQKSFRQKQYICLQQNDNQQKLSKKKNQQTYCELVTRKGVYFCEWRIEMKQSYQKTTQQQTSRKQKFQPILILQTHKQKPQQCPRYLKYGSPVSNLLCLEKQIQIPLKLIREIFFRKYNQIRNNSIELFCSDGRQHFICLYSIDRAEQLTQQIYEKTKPLIKIKIVRFPQKQFQVKGYTNKWANGEIDNFTYLMMVNKYSGRSFCDTNQYPVFPWVVSDYRSSQLNLNDIKTYRDLTKPIGALNEHKLQKYYEKYKLQNEDTGIFLYGSHFSTSLFIYYFLVRMEPFSSLHQQMQGGSWDAPDRLFSSMEHMWESLMSASSATDIKESIPQFYYFPFFLKNTNHIDLGIRQSGQYVNDVILPPWSKTPQQFVYKMRLAFQSNYVSLNIPYWIDLIFGVDQKSIKRHNLFHPLSYSENIHVEKILEKDLEARICQISYFGQFPIKLFNKSHKLKRLAINKIFALDLLNGGLIRSTSSGKKQEEQVILLTLPSIFSVASISKKTRSQNNPSCVLKVKNNLLNTELQVQIDPKVEGLQNIIKKLTSSSKDYEKSSRKRQLSFSTKEMPQYAMRKNKDPHYLGYSEPRTCTIMSKATENLLSFYCASNPNLILASYWFEARYSYHIYNELFVILYGEDGFVILNWNFEEIFCYSKRAIDCCFVDEFLVFIATKDGKVYVYEIVTKNLIHIADLSILEEEIKNKEREIKSQKQQKVGKDRIKQAQPKVEKIYSTKMKVFSDKKLISSSCEEQYKIILVANDNKIFILNYKYLKRNCVNVEKK